VRRQLGIDSGGRRAPSDLIVAHSGQKRGREGQSRATDGEVVVAAGSGMLWGLSGHRLQRRKGQKGKRHTCSPRESKNGTRGSPESTNLQWWSSVPLFTKMRKNGNGVGSAAHRGFGVVEEPHGACGQPFWVLVGAGARCSGLSPEFSWGNNCRKECARPGVGDER
jgi:hypothetical protein